MPEAKAILATGYWIDTHTPGSISGPSDPNGNNPYLMKDMNLNRFWRFGSASDAVVEIVEQPAGGFNFFALIGHSLKGTATIRVRAADKQADLTTSPDYDSGSLAVSTLGGYAGLDNRYAGNVWTSMLRLPDVDQPWWRVDVDPQEAVAEIGRLYIDRALIPEKGGVEYGWSMGFYDPSPTFDSAGGQGYAMKLPVRRAPEGRLINLSEAEASELHEILRLRGRTRDLLLVPMDEKTGLILHQWSVYGRMPETRPIVNPFFDIHELDFVFRELLP